MKEMYLSIVKLSFNASNDLYYLAILEFPAILLETITNFVFNWILSTPWLNIQSLIQ